MGLFDENLELIANNSTRFVCFMERQFGNALVGTFEDDPELRFRQLFQTASHLFSSRIALAQNISKRYPGFTDTYLLIKKNYDDQHWSMETLGTEFDELINCYQEYNQDLDFVILVTCYAWACYIRNEDTAEVLDTLFNWADARSGEELGGIASVLLGIVLWKANYKDFHSLAMDYYHQHKERIEREDREKAEVAARAEREKQINGWKQDGKCAYCGGDFKGLFKKVCSSCGKEKNY